MVSVRAAQRAKGAYSFSTPIMGTTCVLSLNIATRRCTSAVVRSMFVWFACQPLCARRVFIHLRSVRAYAYGITYGVYICCPELMNLINSALTQLSTHFPV